MYLEFPRGDQFWVSFSITDKNGTITENDIYEAEHYDDEGNLIPEHIPYYSTVIFVPDNFTEDEMNNLYVEEEV